MDGKHFCHGALNSWPQGSPVCIDVCPALCRPHRCLTLAPGQHNQCLQWVAVGTPPAHFAVAYPRRPPAGLLTNAAGIDPAGRAHRSPFVPSRAFIAADRRQALPRLSPAINSSRERTTRQLLPISKTTHGSLDDLICAGSMITHTSPAATHYHLHYRLITTRW
jgi:hypothetical protein